MDKYLKEKTITPDEKLEVATRATSIMIEYMGSQKSFQKKQNWMLGTLLLLFVTYAGTQLWYATHPPPTEVERKLLTEKEKGIELQYVYLNHKEKSIGERELALDEREKRDSAIAIKNTADALINLNAQKALAVDRADIAAARTSINNIQHNAIRRDSLFNQKRVLNVKTVNANSVNTVNTNSINIKKK